jgi:acyl carrier protein
MNEKERIRRFIQDNMRILDGEEVVGEQDNIFELGFVDSMFAMKLVTFIEKEFDIVVSNSDLSLHNFSTVENLYSLVMRGKPHG